MTRPLRRQVRSFTLDMKPVKPCRGISSEIHAIKNVLPACSPSMGMYAHVETKGLHPCLHRRVPAYMTVKRSGRTSTHKQHLSIYGAKIHPHACRCAFPPCLDRGRQTFSDIPCHARLAIEGPRPPFLEQRQPQRRSPRL